MIARAVLSIWLLLAFVVPAGAGELPEILYHSDPGFLGPVWVSAEIAFDDEGRLKPSLVSFRQHTDRPHAGVFRSSNESGPLRFVGKDECPDVWAGTIGGPSDRSFEDLIEHSIGIYRGRITEISYGFFFNGPGALLRAEPIEVLRESDQINIESGLLVLYRYSRFAGGGFTFCAGFREPKVGEEFLIFAYFRPRDSLGAIISAGNRIFFQSSSGDIGIEQTRAGTISPGDARYSSLDSLTAAVRKEMGQVRIR